MDRGWVVIAGIGLHDKVACPGANAHVLFIHPLLREGDDLHGRYQIVGSQGKRTAGVSRLTEAFMRVAGLIDPPQVLMSPDNMLRVERASERRLPAPEPGALGQPADLTASQ